MTKTVTADCGKRFFFRNLLLQLLCQLLFQFLYTNGQEFIPIESVMSVAGIFSYTCKRWRRQKTPRICKKSTEKIAQECCHKTLTSELKTPQGNTRQRWNTSLVRHSEPPAKEVQGEKKFAKEPYNRHGYIDIDGVTSSKAVSLQPWL